MRNYSRWFQIVSIVFVLAVDIGMDASANTEDSESNAGTRFETSVSAVGNLFYQIECLGERIRCSRPAYQELWNRIGALDDDDLAAMQQFSSVLDVYDFSAQLGPRSKKPVLSYDRFGTEVVDIGPPPTQSFSLLNRIRLAAYGSKTPEALSERMSLFMHPADVAALDGAIRRLWPRFRVWWEDMAAASIHAFADQLTATLDIQNRVTLPSVVAFFGLKPTGPGVTLTVHLIAHPLELAATSAEVVENQAIVEVLAGESPLTRVGVIVHELVHYLFATAPKAIHDARLEGALRSKSPRAAAALGLMNEALAAAIGNGYVERQIRGAAFDEYFERDGSLYARAEVDIAAKSIYPMVDAYLKNQKTIDDEFIDQYYTLVSDAVGEGLDSLPSRLRVSAYIATDEPLAQAMRRVPRLLGMTSLYGSTLDRGETVADSVLYRHSYLNGVILLREDDRSIAADLLPEASGKVDSIVTGDARSCVYQRPSGSSVYFVVLGSSEPDEESLVEYLLDAKTCE